MFPIPVRSGGAGRFRGRWGCSSPIRGGPEHDADRQVPALPGREVVPLVGHAKRGVHERVYGLGMVMEDGHLDGAVLAPRLQVQGQVRVGHDGAPDIMTVATMMNQFHSRHSLSWSLPRSVSVSRSRLLFASSWGMGLSRSREALLAMGVSMSWNLG